MTDITPHALAVALKEAHDYELAIRAVLDDVASERGRQIAKWGVQHRWDGTGGAGREDAASGAKRACQSAEESTPGGASWRLVLAEEVAEAFAETDPAKLRAELVQICAVAVAWIEDVDTRATDQNETEES